ncbi:MAG: hypothetical protein V7K27_23035 [Nostoc sp.]|uniref:hypothetical protein n=1 Tax=Nostoc sp. TaxID=1180 RepID=UPI002FF81C95
MSHTLINLTLPIVIQEIENVLDEYPEHPYQLAFSIHELRQKLIAHILSHVPNRYVVEGVQELSSTPKSRYSLPLQERIQIETVVHGSILHILRENADWLSRQILTLSLVGSILLPIVI